MPTLFLDASPMIHAVPQTRFVGLRLSRTAPWNRPRLHPWKSILVGAVWFDAVKHRISGRTAGPYPAV